MKLLLNKLFRVLILYISGLINKYSNLNYPDPDLPDPISLIILLVT
jgi:hypothetical protein